MRIVLFLCCAAALFASYIPLGTFAMIGYGTSSGQGEFAPLIMLFFEMVLTLGAIGCGYVLGLWNRRR